MERDVKPAIGTRGFLVWNGNRFVFRVYDHSQKPQTFVDYDISHGDLEVMILARDAAFYDNQMLDYDPATLRLS